ncbi:T-complex protein [Vigna angularis]|uniref:T-complex protein n=1 Tax=Phaseolus angularis TaxID=3914 RepID=A0A8T0KH84_PHAAN|nr:T-complex protein [Vigna angularis]
MAGWGERSTDSVYGSEILPQPTVRRPPQCSGTVEEPATKARLHSKSVYGSKIFPQLDISKVQDDEVGDGTTSVAVLAGELLREAEKLVATKIHPMTIISGFRMAAECARNALLEKVVDNKADSVCEKEFFDLSLNPYYLYYIELHSFLETCAESFILDKKIGIGQPNRIENAKIPVANTAMDTDKVKIYGARIRVDSFYHTEFMPLCSAGQMLYFSQCIVSHHVLDEAERSLHDALCVLSQTVNDSRVLLGGGWPEMVMAKEVDALAKKTPGKSAELISQLCAEHQKEGCTAGIDVISGSVSIETKSLVNLLSDYHDDIALFMFSLGLVYEVHSWLRAFRVGDMAERGICEAFKVKQAVLLSSTEAAEMILRVDEIITCAPRRREDRM